MGVRLPEVHIDAKELISGVLNEANTITISRYNTKFAELGKIKHFHIEPKDEEESDSVGTVDMSITYDIMVKMGEDFINTEVTNDLALLNPKGDFKWNRSLKYKLWEGNYPSTVGVDKSNGDVYLVHLYKDNVIELQEFGVLTSNELELFMGDLDETNPYKIRIANEAMFDYISGDEGLNHLKKNIIVELNCGIPLIVRRGE